MTKRLSKNKSDMELLELRTRLAHQDKMLEQLSYLIKGSTALNLPGIIPMLNKQAEILESMENKIDTRFESMEVKVETRFVPIETWKQKLLDREGMWVINKNNVFVRMGMIITAIGGLIAIVLGVFKVIDWLHGQ